MTPSAWVVLPLVTAAAAAATGIVRSYAVARNLLDVPNHRSAHVVATPRGGGIAIVGVVLIAAAFYRWTGDLPANLAVAILGPGALVAAVGFADDHRALPVAWRLLAHVAASAWAVFWLGGLPPALGLPATWLGGLGGDLLAVVGLVWLLNLYNFMDGIDGIAGLEAVTVGASAAVLWAVLEGTSGGAYLPAVLAAAAAGFLAWNWPPARIFMGDAGSGFLGYAFGASALAAAGVRPEWLYGWAILLAAFVADASVTLVRRWWSGDRIAQAHASHAYQHAARRYGHRRTTLALGAVNLCWLLPIASAVLVGILDGWVGVLAAYAPLTWLAVQFGAGDPTLRHSPTDS